MKNFDDRTVQKEINEKLRIAIRKHNSITKDCLQGHGFDRHFFALKDQAIKNGLPTVSSNENKILHLLNLVQCGRPNRMKVDGLEPN